MSPWHGCGWHQQPSFLPFSCLAFSSSCGWLAIQVLYFWITSSLVPSLPMLYGFPHSDGLPMYMSYLSFLQCTTVVVMFAWSAGLWCIGGIRLCRLDRC